MRCSRGTLNPFACLDSTAVWRGGLMHVVCVCVELQAFCIFGLNCLLAGAVRCTEGDDIYRHKVVMDIGFAAWCEVNIEFAERLFV